jgi:hypothetical protein
MLFQAKSISISVLLLIFGFLGGRSSVRPTHHFLEHHADVEWELVVLTIVCPTRWYPTPRIGKNRYTFIRIAKKHIIEIHASIDGDGNAWVINAFKKER